MTYLGYQVAELEDCTGQLELWLKNNKDKCLKVWGKKVVGSGCDYGTNPEYFPWEGDDIKCFENKGATIEFTTINEFFVVSIVEPPKDKWGNTATYSGGLLLSESFYELAYSDTSYTAIDQAFMNVLENFGIETEQEAWDFIYWVKEKHLDMVGTVSEETVCNGCSNEWEYITTNTPFESNKWMQILTEYAA